MNTKTVQARLAKRLLCIVCAVAGGCGDSTTLRYDPQPPDASAPPLSVTPDTLVFDAEGGTLVLNLATTNRRMENRIAERMADDKSGIFRRQSARLARRRCR